VARQIGVSPSEMTKILRGSPPDPRQRDEGVPQARPEEASNGQREDEPSRGASQSTL
jgi:hypothetical protein